MKKIIVIFLASLLQATSFGQDSTATLSIEVEKDYPYNEPAKDAKKEYTWFINNTSIKYLSGDYSIPARSEGFDTIIFRSINEKVHYLRKEGKRRAKKVRSRDTTEVKTICNFREGNKYSLSQLFPNQFRIFSLDTFNIEKNIVINIENFNGEDTLFLNIDDNYFSVFSDTNITYFSNNEGMKENFASHISLKNWRPRLSRRIESRPPVKTFLDLNYLFLHGEELEIVIDLETIKSRVSVSE